MSADHGGEEQTRLENRRRAVARAIVSAAFGLCQPDKGDVFGWIDDNADKIAAHVVKELNL